MSELLWPIVGFLAGSIPCSYLAGRLIAGKDVRREGSGNVGATNVLRVAGRGAGAAAAAGDVLKSRPCLEVLRNADLTKLSWYDRSFTRGIQGVLSERLAGDFGLPEDRIVLGYGAESILKQTVRCYLRPGETLLVPAYSWWYYRKIASEVGGRSVEYPMVQGEDRFFYDLPGMLEAYVREHPSIVFISSPNNPTGNSLDIGDLRSALSRIRSSVVVLVEAYVFHTRTDYVRELVQEYPNLVVVRTFSKYFALAGARIGYGVLGSNLSVLETHLTHGDRKQAAQILGITVRQLQRKLVEMRRNPRWKLLLGDL